jgi:predicted phage tail protein
MVAQFLIMLAISLAIQIAAYLIMPQPKAPKPEAAKDLENPSAEAGRPIPVVFGTVLVKGVNVLWYGEKQIVTYKVDS